jgi:hypothetical protein
MAPVFLYRIQKNKELYSEPDESSRYFSGFPSTLPSAASVYIHRQIITKISAMFPHSTFCMFGMILAKITMNVCLRSITRPVF